jgi:hypothetical protein
VTTEPLTPADVLDKAAEHIETIGWWQGDYIKIAWSDELDWYVPDQDCPACAVGAINIAADTEANADLAGHAIEAARALAVRLGLVVGDAECVLMVVSQWNDATDRTAEQVVTELRACAADLRQGAG